nr:MAG: MC150R [Molluscum contagiosum virus]
MYRLCIRSAKKKKTKRHTEKNSKRHSKEGRRSRHQV